ncbi:MAG TPA: hypothetical protein PK992_01515 [Planctomycetaceae bacterium]|nr:hypothetical protein [Planctomycetaceae bacterium]
MNPRSRAPALERNALEAPASSENPGRQEPPEQRVPRLEPRNKDINSDRVKYKPVALPNRDDGLPPTERRVYGTWGGALGPKLFSHVICRNCGTGFNRKSGKSNTMAITLYVAISLLVGLGIAILFLFTR